MSMRTHIRAMAHEKAKHQGIACRAGLRKTGSGLRLWIFPAGKSRRRRKQSRLSAGEREKRHE